MRDGLGRHHRQLHYSWREERANNVGCEFHRASSRNPRRRPGNEFRRACGGNAPRNSKPAGQSRRERPRPVRAWVEKRKLLAVQTPYGRNTEEGSILGRHLGSGHRCQNRSVGTSKSTTSKTKFHGRTNFATTAHLSSGDRSTVSREAWITTCENRPSTSTARSPAQNAMFG